jgi:PAS domain S-box-containing protein
MTETTKDSRPALARYGVALAAVGAAFAVTYALQGYVSNRIPFAFFYAAVVIAAFYGGLRPGLLAVAASAALADYFFLPPFRALALDPVGLLQLVVFLSVSLLVCAVIERSRRAEAGRERLRESERAAQAASDEMRAHLAAIVESSDDVIIGKTLDSTIVSWNKAAERTYGYRAEEVVGRSVSVLIPPDKPDELPRIMERLRRGEAIDHYQTERVTKDGRRIYVSLTISPIRNSDGQITGASTIARDITERKRAEAEREQLLAREQAARSATEESELRYRSLVQATTQMVWSTDAEGMIEDMPEWRSLTGQTAEEVRGRGWLDAIHPGDRERVAAVWDEAFASRKLYNVEYRIRSAEGGYRHVSVRGVPIVTPDGRLQEWIGTLTDVTERKRTGAALHEQAEVIEQAYDAIFLRDSSNLITLWNKGAERTYGYTREEALGRSPHELLRTETPIPLEEIYERLRREGYWEGEILHTRKDGARITVESRWATVQGEAGEVTSVLEITRDVTERKRAEVELRRAAAIVENSDDAIISKDLEGIILSWNPGAERLYGYTAREAVGRSVTILIPPDRPDEEPHILEQIKRGKPVDHYETERVTKDGRLLDVSLTVSPVRDAEGRIVGASKIARDITATKRVERELREQAEIIETVNRTGQMIAGELAVEKVVQSVTDAATELSGARFGSFFYNVLDERGASYMLYTLSGVPRAAFAHFPMPRATDLFGPTFRGEGTVLIADVKKDPRYGKNSPYYGMPEGHLPVTSYLAVPVVSRSGEVLGGLFFGHPEPGVFTERAARIIEGLAAQAAVAIDNARLFEAAARERRKAEASEEHYRFLAESIPQIVWTADAEGKADYYNQRGYEYTGLKPGEVTDFAGPGVVHPEDLRLAHERWAEASAAGATFESELRIRRGSDGSYRWHLARAVPLRDAEGRIVKWFGTSTDIDDRKRAEESQRFLAEASEVLVSSLDYEATLARLARLVVPRLADWCSIDMLTEERQLRRLAVAHEDPAKIDYARQLEQRYPPSLSDQEGVAKVLRTGEPEIYPNVPEELLALVAHDSEHLKILRGLGLRSALVVPLSVQGRVIGAISLVSAESGRRYSRADLPFVEDLAHRAALAIENARLYREAQEVNRLKDEFLATLSHELRTPLTAVLGWTRLLGTGQLDAETSRRAMETIERNAQSQVQLIDDILDVSRIIRGKLRLNVRPVDLAPVIESAVDSVRPAAEAKGIRLQVILDRQAGPVSGDPDRLQQVVWNLLSNAIKFTPKEGRVQVLLARVDSQLEVTISDTGQGIAPNFLPYVFDRFRQADPTTTRTHGGLGLGLAIVRHLVELHGGTVRAESAGAGQGSTFRVLLPLLVMQPSEAPPPAEQAAATLSAAAPGPPGFHLECPPELAGLRVLIVEDDADSRELLITVLKQCEAEVMAVSRASDALDALDSWRPDVLVSDIEMPDEDGYTLIRKVRARRPERGGQIPAAALTAYARSEDRMRALLAGFQIHLPKPVEPAELVTVVASLAGRAVRQ